LDQHRSEGPAENDHGGGGLQNLRDPAAFKKQPADNAD
jgi:hypothetical protein